MSEGERKSRSGTWLKGKSQQQLQAVGTSGGIASKPLGHSLNPSCWSGYISSRLRWQEPAALRQAGSHLATSEQTVVSNPDKPFGQHM